ncbi:MAG: VanZ family protein, partial [Clostridia bacterium]|nr:VanZ family protein [Clostridia bacterium]
MKNSRKTLTVVLAIIYGLLLIWIILFKMSSFSAISELDHIRSINLIPFYYDREVSSHFSEVFENVILFIPMGIYLMIIIKRAGYPILFGACFSLALEISQYIFGIGASDITDLITNTTGTALGVLIYLSLLRLCKNEAKLHGTINILALICTIAFIILAAILLLV